MNCSEDQKEDVEQPHDTRGQARPNYCGIGERVDEEKREEQAETGKLHKSTDAVCCQAPRMTEKDGFVMRNHVGLSDPSKV